MLEFISNFWGIGLVLVLLTLIIVKAFKLRDMALNTLEVNHQSKLLQITKHVTEQAKEKAAYAEELEMLKLRYMAGIILFFFIAMVLCLYLWKFNGLAFGDTADVWGQMGDYFGGMLNPIFAFASFLALLYTIRIQSEELRMTREELSKSASAAIKSAELEERNLNQQVINIDRQFNIARYKELMGLVRGKAELINKLIFEDYTELESNTVGRHTILRPKNVPSIRVWFNYQIGDAKNAAYAAGVSDVLLTYIKDRLKQPLSGLVARHNRLIYLRRELVLLGLLLKDLEALSKDEVTFIRADIQFAVGVLLCSGIVLYKDPELTGINSDIGCPFNGFLDGYRIKLDISTQ